MRCFFSGATCSQDMPAPSIHEDGAATNSPNHTSPNDSGSYLEERLATNTSMDPPASQLSDGGVDDNLADRNIVNEWHDVQMSQIAFEEQLCQEERVQHHADDHDLETHDGHNVSVTETPPGGANHKKAMAAPMFLSPEATTAHSYPKDHYTNNHSITPPSSQDAVANTAIESTLDDGAGSGAASTMVPAPPYAVTDATELVLVELEPTCPPPPRGDTMDAQTLRAAAADSILEDVRDA